MACASIVLPPMCGVKNTLSNLVSSLSNISDFDDGSLGNTSIAAPFSFLDFNASTRASISTTFPRDAFISTEFLFHLRDLFCRYKINSAR